MSARRPDIVIDHNKKKKENISNTGLSVQAYQRVKLEQSEIRDKYLDHGTELKDYRTR